MNVFCYLVWEKIAKKGSPVVSPHCPCILHLLNLGENWVQKLDFFFPTPNFSDFYVVCIISFDENILFGSVYRKAVTFLRRRKAGKLNKKV